MPDDLGQILADVPIGATDHGMLGRKRLDGRFLKRRLVEPAVGETHRKGPQPVVEPLFHQGRDVGAVQAAAEVGADRHVGAQPDACRIEKKGLELFAVGPLLPLRLVPAVCKHKLPVAMDPQRTLFEHGEMAGRKLLDPPEGRLRAHRGPAGEDIRNRARPDLARDRTIGE